MKTKTLFFLSLCFMLLGSCKKDSIVTTVTEGQPPAPKITIESTIRGLVLDRQGQPLENASVVWGNNQVETDADGIFIVDDLVNGEQAVLKVSKDGFFDAFQTILPISESTLKTEIQLTPRLLSTSFPAQNGGQLQLPNGSGVDFVANAFTDSQGNVYNGQVNVYATYIDPTDPELDEIMPGNLQALNLEGESQTLQSFGMINVELEGNNGEALQISSPAQLNMPVPSSLLSQAPQSLPLWHFDKASGLWMEEGSANLVGNSYVGEVSHFSFWNCDVPYDLVELSGAFLADKYEVAGQVRVTATALNTQGLANLASDGSFRGKVIKGTPLTLELIDPNCNDVLYSRELGSLSGDLDIGTVNVELNEDWVTISGTLVDCDMETISDGVVVVRIQGNSFLIAPDEDGGVNGAFPVCEATNFTVLGVDWSEQVRGTPEGYAVAPNVDVGNVEACGTAFTAEMRILIPGQADYVISNCIATLEPNDSLAIYRLISNDVQGAAGKVLYTFNFLNWTNDPANAIWGMSFEREVFDAPGVIFQFGGNHEITAIQSGEEPGEVVYFSVDNVSLINEVTGETTENCTLELSAILE